MSQPEGRAHRGGDLGLAGRRHGGRDRPEHSRPGRSAHNHMSHHPFPRMREFTSEELPRRRKDHGPELRAPTRLRSCHAPSAGGNGGADGHPQVAAWMSPETPPWYSSEL